MLVLLGALLVFVVIQAARQTHKPLKRRDPRRDC